MSVQYTTTVVDDRTTAMSPTGGISGEMGSGAITSLVCTDTYTGRPSPMSLYALRLMTYSELGSAETNIIEAEITRHKNKEIIVTFTRHKKGHDNRYNDKDSFNLCSLERSKSIMELINHKFENLYKRW